MLAAKRNSTARMTRFGTGAEKSVMRSATARIMARLVAACGPVSEGICGPLNDEQIAAVLTVLADEVKKVRRGDQ